MTRLKVRYFASVRDWTGVREEVLNAPDGLTAGGLRRLVAGSHGKPELEPTLLVAVNGSFVEPGRVLSEPDDVAVFPPVSGG